MRGMRRISSLVSNRKRDLVAYTALRTRVPLSIWAVLEPNIPYLWLCLSRHLPLALLSEMFSLSPSFYPWLVFVSFDWFWIRFVSKLFLLWKIRFSMKGFLSLSRSLSLTHTHFLSLPCLRPLCTVRWMDAFYGLQSINAFANQLNYGEKMKVDSFLSANRDFYWNQSIQIENFWRFCSVVRWKKLRRNDVD